MIVTFGGTPGSGKTVVATAISKKLGFDFFDVGRMRREAAREKGMTLEELNEWSVKNPKEGDVYFDEYIKKVVSKSKNAVVVGRMAFFVFPDSFKIYLAVDLNEGAKRIWLQRQEKDSRNEAPADSVEKQKKIIIERMRNDTQRYKALYKTDCYDEKNFDLIIDTTKISAKTVTEKVLAAIKKHKCNQ